MSTAGSTGPENATLSGKGPTDGMLVTQARHGAQWAKEALFRRYGPMVNALAFRLVPNHSDAFDIAQDSFIKALTKLHQLKNPQAFAQWLKLVVVRTAAKKIRHRRLGVRLGFAHSKSVDPDEIAANNAPPDIIAELRAVYSHIEAFPVQVRIALILRRIDGLTIPEIAAQMGVSEGTVKRRLKAADRLMKKYEPLRRLG